MSINDTAPSTAPEPASTISVFSQLPADLTETILQVLTGSRDVVENSPYRPWRIKNRYYATIVYFHLMRSVDQVVKNVQAGSPAVLVLLDSSKDASLDFLSQVDVDSIDIPIVAGKASQINTVGPDIADECFTNGWEYINLDESGQDEAGGQTGHARLSEALQAHTWPILDNEEATSKSEQASEHLDQPKTGRPELAFYDDFAPFVSSSNTQSQSPTSADNYLPAEDWEKDLSLDDTDDPSDPAATATLANMFASLADLKDQAMSMPDGDRRKDFAAEVAMKFAKRLDSLIDDKDDDEVLDEKGM